MSNSPINMLQTQGQMQAQDVELKQKQVGALGKSNLSPAEKEKKLREACEGFESIFIQKMWQQMRATLPQENPLVGREEKFWQGMYDQELAKKMASSGGIGLADMMYDQLSQNLVSASRTTADNASKTRGFEINPLPLMPKQDTALASNDTGKQNVNVAHANQSKANTKATDIYAGVAQVVGNNPQVQAANNTQHSHMVAASTMNNVSGQNANPNTPLVDQYLNNLMAKQQANGMANGHVGMAQNTTTGLERARQVQQMVANQPPANGVLPQSNLAMSGHAMQAQNVFVQPAGQLNTGNTGAALLQAQIGGQAMENNGAQVVRTTYTTNLPENQRNYPKQARQRLTSGQPMIHNLVAQPQPYGASQNVQKSIHVQQAAQANGQNAVNVQTQAPTATQILEQALNPNTLQSQAQTQGQNAVQGSTQPTAQVAQNVINPTVAPVIPITKPVDES